MIDNESRELLAVHHTGFIVAEAGQIYRAYTNRDHGIAGEIGFNPPARVAADVRRLKLLRDTVPFAERVSLLTSAATIWQCFRSRIRAGPITGSSRLTYAVMLVIRTSDGEIRWMDVTACLKRESAGGKTVQQIVFNGERFDAVRVQNWRKKVLGGGRTTFLPLFQGLDFW